VPLSLLNMDFGGAFTSPETGPGVAGAAGSNFWNYLGFQIPGPIGNLLEPDGRTPSGVSLTASNFPGAWGNGSTEPMYAGYIYAPIGQSGTMTFSNLPVGTCSVYVYSFDGDFTLTVGGVNYGTNTTVYDYPVTNPPPWIEWLHYALWTGVSIPAGQPPMVLTVWPGRHDNYAVISGMQIAYSVSGATPPSITTEPQNQTVCASTSASFSVVATGTAPLSYQWTFNGAAIAGATASVFTTNNVQTWGAGAYGVTVSNSAGAAVSFGAILTVNGPAIIIPPASQSVAPGANVSFSVTATGALPFTYQWTCNGTNIPGATTSIYAINNAQTTSAGQYGVLVSGSSCTSTSPNATLSVGSFDVWISEPKGNSDTP
jgi:hypothetical protein